MFAWDAAVVRVERIPALSSCEMTVALTSTLHETKEIQAFNLFLNNWVDSISTFGAGQTISMNIRKAAIPGQACGTGTDTVVLCRHFAWPRGRTALYTFPPEDFWDFWGGCKVTFEWFSDTVANGKWGSQTPEPVYPLVAFPDGTLLRDGADFCRLRRYGLRRGDDSSSTASALEFDAVAAVPSPKFRPHRWTARRFAKRTDPRCSSSMGAQSSGFPTRRLSSGLASTGAEFGSSPRVGRPKLGRCRSMGRSSRRSTTQRSFWSTTTSSDGSRARPQWTGDAFPGATSALSRTDSLTTLAHGPDLGPP